MYVKSSSLNGVATNDKLTSQNFNYHSDVKYIIWCVLVHIMLRTPDP